MDRRIRRDQRADKLRSGRCRRCRLLYRWKPGKGRELYRARCIQCGDPLGQTTAANFKRAPRIPSVDPRFYFPQPCATEGCDHHGTEREKLCTCCLVKQRDPAWVEEYGTEGLRCS